MMTIEERLSPLSQRVREQWPDLSDDQAGELEQVWSAAEPGSAPLPGWVQRGLAPDAGESERQAVAEYADGVTGRAGAVGLVQDDAPPIEQIPAIAAVLAWLEERELITGPENTKLPPRCAVCHGPAVEESGWLCSPCYMDQQSAIPESASEDQPPDMEAVQAPGKAAKRKKQAEAPEASAVPVTETEEEIAAPQAAEHAEPALVTVEEVVVPPVAEVPAAISSTLPDFTHSEATYAALSTDSANNLRIEMVLQMDRLPHRWQAIYSTVDASPITLEQYRVSKLIHENLESDLSRLMAEAAWRQTPTGGWVAPWESE